MSKVIIQGDVNGTGVFTIAAPNSNNSRNLALPDLDGIVMTSATSVAVSQITAALNATGSAPLYTARAWVNFNGTGTVAIRASGNVSSITDNGTGDYTVNFSTAMPDANFATAATAHDVATAAKARFVGSQAKTISTARIYVSYQDNLLIDAANVEVAVFR